MQFSLTTILGFVFLLLALASTFLMFRFWGYPYDHATKKSACPQWKMNVHRAIGFAYLAVYLIMMVHMVPRLWQYQIEFPARTVAHIMLGMTIGVILLLKLSILRWFRHFEEWMPVLGVLMLLCTVLLLGLSLPFAVRAAGGVGDGAFTDDNRARVRELLTGAGIGADVDLDALASEQSLMAGRRVLLDKCTFCHDLKTAIARPRTPEDWHSTVARMADKPTLGPRLEPSEVDQVTAYLVAITPELQLSAKAKRAGDQERSEAKDALEEMEAGGTGDDDAAAAPPTEAPPASPAPSPSPSPSPSPKVAVAPVAPKPKPKLDRALAKATFQRVCSKCHPADDIADAPPKTRKAVDALIGRMIDNGLEAKKSDLALVRAHLIETYAR